MPTLKRLREEALLSQTELAQLCGVSRHTIWKWEHGQGAPSPAHRRKLVEIFRKEPKELLEAIETTAKAPQKEQPAA
jgi:transcriptional regulator with XRE-family HTH domain